MMAMAPLGGDTCMRVFLSSTYMDLIEDRATVAEVVSELATHASLQLIAMEGFGSEDSSPLELSEQAAHLADLVILLLGSRYGSPAPDSHLSFGEHEYNVVSRNKIPVLVYVSSAADSAGDEALLRLRARAERDHTVTRYSSLEELKSSVKRDVEREMNAIVASAPLGSLLSPPPTWTSKADFVGRRGILGQLSVELAKPGARAAVWGPPGIGKTSLAEALFSRGYMNEYTPIWLRANEVFGREASGRRRFGALRWTPAAAAEAFFRHVRDDANAILVVDNVQAAPHETKLLSVLLGRSVRILYLTWDLGTLPPTPNEAHALTPLSLSEAVSTLRAWAGEDRAVTGEQLEEVARQLDCHPMALELAGRQLALDTLLTVEELSDRLTDYRERLSLTGDTLDRADAIVRTTLLSSYQELDPTEAVALRILAASGHMGLSFATVQWVMERVGGARSTPLSRSRQLGLIELRKVADYEGNMFRLRSLVRDLLQSVDAGGHEEAEWEARIASDDALHDPSVAVIFEAITVRLEGAGDANSVSWDWLDPLVRHSRPAIRRVAHSAISGSPPLGALRVVLRVLEEPREPDVARELLQLLGGTGFVDAEPLLRRFWRKPIVLGVDNYGSDTEILDYEVGADALRALCRLENEPTDVFLRRAAASGKRDLLAVLETLPFVDHGRDLRALAGEATGSQSPAVRREACRCLGNLDPDPESDDRSILWDVFSNDPDETVAFEAACSLGVWQDSRVIEAMLDRLESTDEDTRATAISVLWRFPRPDVLDLILTLADSDPSPDVRLNSLFVLSDNADVRAISVLEDAIDQGLVPTVTALFFICQILRGETSVPEATKSSLNATLNRIATSQDVDARIVARVALRMNGDLEAFTKDHWRDLRADQGAEDLIRVFALFEHASDDGQGVPEELLLRLVADDEPSVRLAAAIVAGQRRDPGALAPALEDLLDDRTRTYVGVVAETAREALERISGTRERWKPFKKRAFMWNG